MQYAPSQFYGMPSGDQAYRIYQIIRVREAELAHVDSDITQVRALLQRLLGDRENIRESLEAHKAMIIPPPLPAMDRVPAEIWGLIFMACNEVTWSPGSPRLDPDSSPLLLGRVCSHWRIMSLEMPSLWTSICIHKRTRASVAPLLETWLQRSASMPLSIEIHGRSSQDFPSILLDAFVPHSTRWKDLALFLPNTTSSALFSRPELTLPSLETLMIRLSGSAQRISIGASATRMHSVALVTSRPTKPDPHILNLGWSRLTRLSIMSVNMGCIDDCYDVLAQCVALTHCVLSARECARDAVPHSPIRLEKLSSLQVASIGDITHLIGCLVVPSLLQLEMDFVDITHQPDVWPRNEVMNLIKRSSCQLQSLILRNKTIPEADLVECCRCMPSLLHLLVTAAKDRDSPGSTLELLRERSSGQ